MSFPQMLPRCSSTASSLVSPLPSSETTVRGSVCRCARLNSLIASRGVSLWTSFSMAPSSLVRATAGRYVPSAVLSANWTAATSVRSAASTAAMTFALAVAAAQASFAHFSSRCTHVSCSSP